MILILTTSQMRRIDEEAIDGDVSVGFRYMRMAAQGLFVTVSELIKEPSREQVAIVCGKGNNGGDGFVLGSLLLDNGYKPMCFGLCDPEQLTGEAGKAYEEYLSKSGNFFRIMDTEDLKGFSDFTVIVDAILGTGITGDPHGLAAEAITIINKCGKKVVAVDTPSGLNNDTGEIGYPTVMATVTVAMGYPKIGQLHFPGRQCIGRLIVKDPGYPDEIVGRNNSKVYAPAKADLRRMIPPRKSAGSKFDHGLAFMLCGSRGMAGSAALAARAAHRTGCGMVHLAAPRSAAAVLAVKLTETVIHQIDETEDGSLAIDALQWIAGQANNMHAVLIGPGISHNIETSRLVRDCITRLNKPVVLDADGISAFKGCPELLSKRLCELVITPHEGEWRRVFGQLPAAPVERIGVLVEKARLFSMTILYKGNPTVVALPDGRAFIIAVGNSGMATAGSGDVLSGIIVSLIAQGCTSGDAAVLGACIHGLAGDNARARLSEYSIIAGDLVEHIPCVMQDLAGPVVPAFLPEK
jgi:NAD(P)H-hydrate epimerase